MSRFALPSMSVRRLLQVWAVVTLAAISVLAVTTLLSNDYIVTQQERLSQEVLPSEAASRELLQAISELTARQGQLFSARTRADLASIPLREGIESRVDSAFTRLETAGGNNDRFLDIERRLHRSYSEALLVDAAAIRQVNRQIDLAERMVELIADVETCLRRMQMTMETLDGALSLEDARERHRLRELLRDGSISMESLRAASAAASRSGEFAVHTASDEVQRGIVELSALTYQLMQSSDVDRINDLGENEIRPRITQVAASLGVIRHRVEGAADRLQLLHELDQLLLRLTGLLIDGDGSAARIRREALGVAVQLRESQDQAARSLERVGSDLAALSREAGKTSREAMVESQQAAAVGWTVVVVVGLLVTTVIAALITILMRRISQPLGTLRTAMHRISAGDLSTRLDATTAVHDEFSDLAVDFNRAAETMQGLVQELAEAQDRLQLGAAQMKALLNAVPDGLITFDDQGVVLSANPAAERLYGAGNRGLDGRRMEELIVDRPAVDDVGSDRPGSIFEHAFSGGRRALALRVDGTGFPAWVSTEVVAGDERAVNIAVVSDMTAFIEAENARAKNESLFRTIYENVPVMIAGFDGDGTCVLWNRELERAIGWTREEAGDYLRMLKMLYPREADMRSVRKALRRNDGVFQELSPVARDGTRKTHLWARFRLEDGLNIFTGYDITARKEAEEQLRATTLQLQSVLQNALVGIAQVTDGRLVRVNRRLEQLFGFESGTLEGSDIAALLQVPSTREAVLEAMRQRLGDGHVYQEEIALIRRDGSRFWGAVSVNPIDRDNPANGAIWLVEDVTPRRETEEKLRYLASFDPLTRLPNRVLLHDRLRRALAAADRNEQRVAVLFADLDHFKLVNDSLGHSAGDQLLREIAQRLASCVRASDTVARLGGDEFAIVLDGLEHVADALSVAKKIISTLVIPCDLDGHEVTISPSIGIAIYPDDGREIDVLLRNADAAMYHAKQAGRSGYRIYNPEMNESTSRQVRLAASLRRAMENGELRLEYQPQMDIASGRMVAVEALLRWDSAEHGRVPPDQFIPILEDNGLIGPVGDWVLRQALREGRSLLDRGICIAVNISGRQFRDEHLAERIAALLQESGVRPDLLELELTETVVMSDTDVALRNLQRLNELGVRISIDDFGMGYSSLAYLKRFPIDALKIDRSFIRDIPGDPDDTAIVEAIIAMARRLGLLVVAEGVETPAQFDFLRMNQCQRAQGWLLSRAFPIQTVIDMAEKQSRQELPTAVRAAVRSSAG